MKKSNSLSKFKGSKYKKVFDILKLEKINSDGNKYYNGTRGRYLFIFTKGSKRIGEVILNRVFLTGLFRPKHSEKYKTFLGDDKENFLIFQETKKEEITIYSWKKRKKS